MSTDEQDISYKPRWVARYKVLLAGQDAPMWVEASGVRVDGGVVVFQIGRFGLPNLIVPVATLRYAERQDA